MKKENALIILVAMVALLAVIGLIFAFPTNSKKGNTRLFFELPDFLIRRNEITDPINFYFKIENNENIKKNYEYWVVQEDYKNKLLIDSRIEKIGYVVLNKGEKVLIDETIMLKNPATDLIRIRVILQDPLLEINFWSDIYDKHFFNRTFYCGIDVTGYEFDNEDWDRNDPEITRGMSYCERYIKD